MERMPRDNWEMIGTSSLAVAALAFLMFNWSTRGIYLRSHGFENSVVQESRIGIEEYRSGDSRVTSLVFRMGTEFYPLYRFLVEEHRRWGRLPEAEDIPLMFRETEFGRVHVLVTDSDACQIVWIEPGRGGRRLKYSYWISERDFRGESLLHERVPFVRDSTPYTGPLESSR